MPASGRVAGYTSAGWGSEQSDAYAINVFILLGMIPSVPKTLQQSKTAYISAWHSLSHLTVPGCGKEQT